METKKCPYCSEEIKVDAIKCRFCGEWLEQKPEDVVPSDQESIGQSYNNNVGEKIDFVEHEVSDEHPKNKVIEQTKNVLSTNPKTTHLLNQVTYIAIVIVIFLFIGGYGWYYTEKVSKREAAEAAQAAITSQRKYNEKAKAIEQFEHNAKMIKVSAITIKTLSTIILYDIYISWAGSIYKSKAYNDLNKLVYCDNIDDAIKWRLKFYRTQNVFLFMESCYNGSSELMEDMKNPPDEKCEDISEKIIEIFNKTEALYNFCVSPQGNIDYFKQKSEELVAELESAIEASDAVIDKLDEEAKLAVDMAMSDEAKRFFAEVLSEQR